MADQASGRKIPLGPRPSVPITLAVGPILPNGVVSDVTRPGTLFPMEVQRHRREWGGKLRLDLRVPPTPATVSHVRRAFGELPLPTPLLDDARLLVSELVTNSLRHGEVRRADRIRIVAELSGRRLRVDVFDREEAPVPPPVAAPIRPAPEAESGWGLYLVDRLATRWGSGRGRCWFELELAERDRTRMSVRD
jgi:hypothetical protein